MSDKFPERLRGIREVNGKTQSQVSEEIGVTTNTYSHYERNNKRPAIKTFAALCLSLGTPAERLLADRLPKRHLTSEQIENLRLLDKHKLSSLLCLLQTIYENQQQ